MFVHLIAYLWFAQQVMITRVTARLVERGTWVFQVGFPLRKGRRSCTIQRARILFVDDEPGMREMVAMLLSEEGYEVLTAVDGLDALAQLRSVTPNLILSDLNMPRMSGFEFLSVVRRRFPSIPVIAISGALSTVRLCLMESLPTRFIPRAVAIPMN